MILDIFFKFFHLGIFVAVGIYFFKKFYFQDIKNKIKEEKDLIKDLEKEQRESLKRVSASKSFSETELQNCKILNQNIILWKNNFEQKQDKKIEQIQRLRSALNEKINFQIERYHEQKAEEQIFPEIIDQLEAELYKHYSSQSHANDYMAGIEEFLNKSSK